MNQMANHAYASIRDFGDLLDYLRSGGRSDGAVFDSILRDPGH